MFIDSNQFDLEALNSAEVNSNTPKALSDKLVPVLERLIEKLDEEDPNVELRLRSILDILVISKLQSATDRTELDRIKDLLMSTENTIATMQPWILKTIRVARLDSWVIIVPELGAEAISEDVCAEIEQVVDHCGFGKHYILDFGWSGSLAKQMLAYSLGVRSMVAHQRGKLSIAWLPALALTPSLQATLVSRFNFLKKGSFLLSRAK